MTRKPKGVGSGSPERIVTASARRARNQQIGAADKCNDHLPEIGFQSPGGESAAVSQPIAAALPSDLGGDWRRRRRALSGHRIAWRWTVRPFG